MEFVFRLSDNASNDTPNPTTPITLAQQDDASDTERRVQELVSKFVYLSEHKALVCEEHGYAIDVVKGHLQREHKNYDSDVVKAVVQHYSSYEIARVDDIEPPDAGQAAIECLRTPVRGFSCAYRIEEDRTDDVHDAERSETEPCGYISTNRKKIGQHCRKKHGWNWTKADRECWTEVYVQAFSIIGGHQKWFIVKTPDEAAREAASIRESLPQTKQIQFDNIKGDFQKLKEQHQKEQEILSDKVEKCENTGWWNKTRWREHLKKCNLIHLSQASRLPDKDEEVLLKAAAVIDLMVERGVSGLSSMPDGLRRWLRSAAMDEQDKRPLARMQNSESQERYAGYWKRLVCYCLRVWTTRDDDVANNHNIDTEDEDESQSNSGSDSDVDVDVDIEEPRLDTETQREQATDKMRDARRLFPWNDRLEKAVENVWTSLLLEGEPSSVQDAQIKTMVELGEVLLFRKVWNDRFDSAMLHFMAVMGVDEENGRLRDGNDYSYMIAGLVYVARIVAAEFLLPSLEREHQGEVEFKAFLEQRKEYLADGSMSVMGEMLSLLAYGKTIAKNFHAQGKVRWTHDGAGVALGSIHFTVHGFKHMTQSALDDCEDYMWRDLMWAGRKEDRFVKDLDDIVDDMTIKKIGWYFGADPNQNLEQQGLEWMLKRMLGSSTGKKMRRNDQWQSRLVADYLRKVDKFRKLFLFCVHVSSGQPARGTEVTSLRFRNGVANHRNVFVTDGRVMTVTSYHKSMAMLDMPKMVPRFLPWRLGQIAVIYLTHVRNFAELLSIQVQYGQGWSEYIWADANGPWETQKLTDTMKQETGKRLEAKLQVQSYRHAAVFLGRRFVGPRFAKGYRDMAEDPEDAQVGDDEELEQGNAIELQKAGGFHTGAGRYAVRADILKYLNQESIDVFGDLSEGWHEFLELDHRDPRRKRKATIGKGEDGHHKPPTTVD